MNKNQTNKLYDIYQPLFNQYGPKAGIERSDEEIRGDIIQAFESSTQLDPREIIVEVKNGVVTLSGVVNSEEERLVAENYAQNTIGVVDVHNELQTRQNNQII
ncbi:MAG: BON domain-containing protein [Armatimonadota bacterium]|nr:BON domain-containing protein [Armatimonadota bacterium]